MTLDEKAKHVSRVTGLPYHLFLGYVLGDIALECAAQDNLKPSDADLLAFENEIDWTMPDEFKRFVRNFGALFLYVKEQSWPKVETGTVMPFWATNYGFIIYGFGSQVPEHLDLRRKFYQFKDVFPDLSFFFPIHRLVPGDQTYTGFNKDGVLCMKFSWESELRPLDITFDEYVVAEAKELTDRMIKRADLDI